jgi:hypothetical protein
MSADVCWHSLTAVGKTQLPPGTILSVNSLLLTPVHLAHPSLVLACRWLLIAIGLLVLFVAQFIPATLLPGASTLGRAYWGLASGGYLALMAGHALLTTRDGWVGGGVGDVWAAAACYQQVPCKCSGFGCCICHQFLAVPKQHGLLSPLACLVLMIPCAPCSAPTCLCVCSGTRSA